ncbi:MAG: hypothetical protein U5K30_11440 [Acidimicrobiales bacterium]|nr:hypothetical protein [Acidimicrobiales bacterium]
MESYRIIADHVDVDGAPVDCSYADMFVVLRDGAEHPAPTDWEAQIRTDRRVPMAKGRRDLAFRVPDGSCLRGAAFVRFSDGHRHLFRGDGDLRGFEREHPLPGH